MRKHVLIGRFGPDDLIQVPVAPMETETILDLISSQRRLDHGIGQTIDDLTRMGILPSETALDLLIVAALVHAADTRISRNTESQDTWTREIRLVIPVSDVDRWNATTPLLTRILNFLTGDKWTINFRSRPPSFSTVISGRSTELIRPTFDGVSLFSGGLDSLVGAIDELAAGGSPLLVSHAGEGATSKAQAACFNAIRAHYPARPFNHLRIWTNFPKNLVRDVESEDTMRGRSFLFFALGIFAGSGFDGDFVLRAPENGLIALNVPVDPLRLGSLSTRTTHPFYMARWNEMFAALGIPGRVENPYWNKTKGEMVTGCANFALLQQIVPRSLSCSSPSKGRWQGHGTQHCGYCMPCLIRRAALEVSLGQGIDPTIYTLSDLRARVLNTERSEGQQVRSFQVAIERLRAYPHIAKFLIYKPGPLSDKTPGQIEELAGVYQRGMSEVALLLRDVHTRPE